MLSAESHAKLIKLIRLLSSPHDGECLGAARGIERVLKSSGLSFHDLAKSFADAAVEVEKIRVVKQTVIVEKTKIIDPCKEWKSACRQLLDCGKLSEREEEFVRDMQRRFILHPEFAPSQKQINWFVAIWKAMDLHLEEVV